MKQISIYYHVFLLVFFFISCNHEIEDSNNGLIISSVSFGNCNAYFIESDSINFEKEIIIRNKEEYNSFLKHIERDSLKCKVTPEIDFEKFTLIGKGVKSKGNCEVAFVRNFIKTNNIEYKYLIKLLLEGDCESATFSMNYILVPKIEENAKVVFEVIK